ncbi:MAG: hypothetical protein ABIR70_18775 [Bryobacteraceae bacterium]
MKSLKVWLLPAFVSVAMAQTPSSLNFTAKATLIGTSSYSFSGTANLTGLGTATLSGVGVVDSNSLSEQPLGLIPGSFAMIFPDGAVLNGAFKLPSNILLPQLGGASTGDGSIRITGGAGRFEGARGAFLQVNGTGTATGGGGVSLEINGSGTLTAGQYVLPQLVYGGGWYSALYFHNSMPTSRGFTVEYFTNDGRPLSIPVDGTSTPISMAGNGSVRLEFPNSGALVEGFAKVALPEGVTGYGVFRQSVPGIADQEAVVPLVIAGSMQSLLTFDETNYTTAAAFVNSGLVGAIVNVTATSINGTVIGTASIPMGAGRKNSVVLRNLAGMSGIIGTRGTATFTVTAGAVAVLGLRFNGAAFTSIPTVAK